MLVVDLRHWLLPSGDLHPAATLAPHVALVVECATVVLETGITAMPCRHRDGRRRCAGHIVVRMDGEHIDWSCVACGDDGVVTGWTGSHWDLTDAEVLPDDEDHGVYLPTDELRALRDLPLGPGSLRAALAGAALVRDDISCLSLTIGEIRLIEVVIANAELGGRARHRLDRALGRLQQVRLQIELARRARAH
jgi:hypothetical protein